MRQALTIQSVMMVVLILAEIVTHARTITRSVTVLAYSVGALMIGVYFLVDDRDIGSGWAAFVTVAMIFKNLALAGQLYDSFALRAKDRASVPLAFLELRGGRGISDPVLPLCDSVLAVAAAGRIQEAARPQGQG